MQARLKTGLSCPRGPPPDVQVSFTAGGWLADPLRLKSRAWHWTVLAAGHWKARL